MADDKPPAPDSGGDKTDSARLDALEQRESRVEGLLEQVLERLPGKPAPDDTGDGTGGQPPPPDISSAVRAEIEAAQQRQAEQDRAKADADWRASVDEQLEKLKPEQRPRMPQTGLRGRLQRAMFGSEDR